MTATTANRNRLYKLNKGKTNRQTKNAFILTNFLRTLQSRKIYIRFLACTCNIDVIRGVIIPSARLALSADTLNLSFLWLLALVNVWKLLRIAK